MKSQREIDIEMCGHELQVYVTAKPGKRLRYIIADAERARQYRTAEFEQDFERPLGGYPGRDDDDRQLAGSEM